MANLLSLYVIALFVLRAASRVKRRDLLTVSVQAAISGCAAHVQRNTDMTRKLETASCLYPWRAAQVLKMHFEILFLLTSVIQLKKEQLQALCHRCYALCVWLRRICMCQWEMMWFFCNFRAIATISFPRYLKSFGYLCFSETIFSTCLFSLWSDRLGFGRLQQQQALPFQYFCPLLGNFLQEATVKQFLCLWMRGWGESHRQQKAGITIGCSFSKPVVKNVVPECDHYIAIRKHKWCPLANMSHPYTMTIHRKDYHLL